MYSSYHILRCAYSGDVATKYDSIRRLLWRSQWAQSSPRTLVSRGHRSRAGCIDHSGDTNMVEWQILCIPASLRTL
jgi:hypothetical protein